MQRRTRLEGIAQLLGRGTQARGREYRKGSRIGFAVRQRLQHAAGTDAEQVRHEAGHLDVRFLEQGLQPILQLYVGARQVSLVFASWNQLDGWLRRVEGLRRAA
jgi:hypothetical protein